MEVVALHAEMDDPESEPILSSREGACQRPEAASAPQVPDLVADTQRNVYRVPGRELRPAPMRHAAACFPRPPRAGTKATASRITQHQLGLSRARARGIGA